MKMIVVQNNPKSLNYSGSDSTESSIGLGSLKAN